MSSTTVLGSLPTDHFHCSICSNIFNDPVTTPCGHSFCKSCLNQQWDRGEFCQCPTCKKRFSVRPEMSTNSVIEEISVQLKRRKVEIPTIVDGLSQVECDVCMEAAIKAAKSCLVCQTSYCSEHLEPHLRVPALMRHRLIDPVDNIEERICPIHDKALDFYCRDDEVCICVVCIETDHQDHNVVSLEEEGVQMKEKIVSQIAQVKMMIEERVDKIKQFTDSSVIRNGKAQEEIQNMDSVMTTFVRHMQEAQTKVKTSIEEKLKTYKERDEGIIKELQEEVSHLQLKRSELEELMQSDDALHLLQTLQTISSRSEMKDWTKTMVNSDVGLETVRLAVSELLDTFQSILKSLIKKEIVTMKQHKETLIFDSATAGRRLVVYDADKRIKHHKYSTQTVTDSPDRFGLPMVFTKQGFTCGRHYWEVQVGSRSNWDVGVAKESVARKGVVSVEPDDGFYAIDKEDLFIKCQPYKVVHFNAIPIIIGVFLDYEEGRVSFYDINKHAHILSFTGKRFCEKLYPYFYLYSKAKKSDPMELCSMYDWSARLTNVYNLEKKEENQEQSSSSGVSGAAASSQPETMSK